MLNQQQLKRIEQRLLEERQKAAAALRELGSDLEGSEDAGGELSNIPTHLADLGSNVQEEEMDLVLAEQQLERLHAIDEALVRLRQTPQEIDVSVVSGRPIPFERLELIPWTRVLADEDGADTRAR
jgi:RNA polymerase-binding transcription factor DksA